MTVHLFHSQLFILGKPQVLLTALTMTLFCYSYNSVTENQHAQYQDPETEAEAAKSNSDIINFIIYTCISYCDMSKCHL